MTNIRVGIGYDIHQLAPNLPFLLGGIKLKHEKGVVAHSDGDIVFHAISDALLGAAGMGDIGHFFPDDNLKYKNIDSSIILTEVIQKLNTVNYCIVNIDITIVLEKPKLNPIIFKMKESIISNINKALDLKNVINKNQINIKATTSERMGFIGKEEGVACYAVALIEKI